MSERVNQVTRTGKSEAEARVLCENAASQFLFKGKSYRVNLIRYSGKAPNVSCTIQFAVSD